MKDRDCMKFIIKHESKGRIRVHMDQKHMTCRQADTLACVLANTAGITSAKVYDRTADVAITYIGSRKAVLDALKGFHYEKAEVPEYAIENTSRELNNTYQEKLIGKFIWHYGKRLFLPLPVRTALKAIKSVKYICQ